MSGNKKIISWVLGVCVLLIILAVIIVKYPSVLGEKKGYSRPATTADTIAINNKIISTALPSNLPKNLILNDLVFSNKTINLNNKGLNSSTSFFTSPDSISQVFNNFVQVLKANSYHFSQENQDNSRDLISATLQNQTVQIGITSLLDKTQVILTVNSKK